MKRLVAGQEHRALPGFRGLILHPYSILVVVSISVGGVVGSGSEIRSHICSQSTNAQSRGIRLLEGLLGELEPKSGSVVVR